jgi:hypothetical protein
VRASPLTFQNTYPVIIGSGAPPLITSQGDIVPGLDIGVTAGLAPGTLRNQSKDPVMVTEIRIANQAATSYSRRGGAVTVAAGNISLEMRVGNVFLTRDFVPYWLFGQQVGLNGALATQTWRLPKPLFLSPGEEVFVRFKNLGTVDATTQQITAKALNVTLAGYGLQGCTSYPKTIPVPYITTYIGPTSSAAGTILESVDTDLVNPFDVPMFVNRFVGALAVWTANAGAAGALSAYADAAQRQFTISMVDHLANGTIRDAVQWGHLFGVDLSWVVNTVLPPKGYYLATVNVGTDTLGSQAPLQPLIGMIGTREVNLG